LAPATGISKRPLARLPNFSFTALTSIPRKPDMIITVLLLSNSDELMPLVAFEIPFVTTCGRVCVREVDDAGKDDV